MIRSSEVVLYTHFSSSMLLLTSRSNRPARVRAGSKDSTRFVAAITRMPSSTYLIQQLIDSLSTVVRASHFVSLSSHSIELIDKHDTRSLDETALLNSYCFPCFLEQGTNTFCSHSYQHFIELRSSHKIEWNTSLTCHSSSKKSLTSSRRTCEENATRRFGSNEGEFLRIL